MKKRKENNIMKHWRVLSVSLCALVIAIGSVCVYHSTDGYKRDVVEGFCSTRKSPVSCMCHLRAIRVFGGKKQSEKVIECSKKLDKDCFVSVMLEVARNDMSFYSDYIDRCEKGEL